MSGAVMLREFFLGFVKIHILYHAANEPIYGAWLMRELGRHGYRLSPGTLYPTLHYLEKGGYLEKELRVVGGRQRKYYRTTDGGRVVLAEARKRISELVREVVREESS